ncbi:sensor histidine kinase [Azospira sp. I09]|jgi:signal transduction histidine kinase|uniref:sensor histidine kinase n=1 Tax=Azospira sp. I09 TaxID=1765049 RepID=UPI001260F613|nr:ATP-binding protein [Azospira sp. I09]BBN87905.1 hypothetical protein AZSP09_09280 [Azospira sp. I09]
MDNEQFFERFRNLSRDIQFNTQKLKSKIDEKAPHDQLTELLSILEESWQDFSSWVTLSTLDSDEDLLENCAPGFLSLQSKINRLIKKNFRACNPKKMSIRDNHNYKSYGDLKIQTYIQYFEQILDLVVNNAIKYSPPSYGIDIDWERITGSNRLKISIISTGPFIELEERARLGEKGFRAKSALNTKVTGSGYGLYNVKRLANLLKGSVAFRVGQHVYDFNQVPYGKFQIDIVLPIDIEMTT